MCNFWGFLPPSHAEADAKGLVAGGQEEACKHSALELAAFGYLIRSPPFLGTVRLRMESFLAFGSRRSAQDAPGLPSETSCCIGLLSSLQTLLQHGGTIPIQNP